MSRTHFDLRDCPWVPVFSEDGDVRELSLRQVLHQAQTIRDLAVSVPPAASALLRVLYTVTARVTGLDDPQADRSAWERRRNTVLQAGSLDHAAVDHYLDDRTGDRWDVFDPQRPWLQDPRLATQASPVGINRLDPTRPRDRSPVWFRHTHVGHAPSIPAPQAVQWLLVQHFYGPGGGGGARTIGDFSDHYLTSGPLRGVLTHYPLGRTLFETLVTGIPPCPAVEPGEDRAPWECDEFPDPLGPAPAATWPAGVLVGRARHATLLHADADGDVIDCRLTWAFKKSHTPVCDPYTIQQRSKTGEWRARDAKAGVGVWRQMDAWVADTAEHQRPSILAAAMTLPGPVRDALRVRVHGVDQDRQATDRQWFTDTSPEILRWFDDMNPPAARGITALREAADDVANTLRYALNGAYRSLTNSAARPERAAADAPWTGQAVRQYWHNAESLFWRRMQTEDFTEPYRACAHVALDAVEATTRTKQHHPPVAREIARACHRLRRYTVPDDAPLTVQ